MYNALFFSTVLNLLLVHVYGKSSNSLEFVLFFNEGFLPFPPFSALLVLRTRKGIKTLPVDNYLHLKQKMCESEKLNFVYFTSIFTDNMFCRCLLSVSYVFQSHKMLPTAW